MEGGFQKSLQLFVVNGYCLFEDNLCVDLSCVLDGRPNYANITFSELFPGPCVDRTEVMDKGPCHAPDSRSDPIGESEPVSGAKPCTGTLFFFFFFLSLTYTCGYTNNFCNNQLSFTYTKELPPEWYPL